MTDIDTVILNFDQSSVWLLNVCLAVIMYGVALGLDLGVLKNIWRSPKRIFVGLLSQWICLPLATLLLIYLWKPQPSFALGMILVACCPGGNISNFFSALAKAHIELSITLTTISSISSIILTPLLFTFYAGLFSDTQKIMELVRVDWIQVITAIFIIIFVPIVLGELTKKYWSGVAQKIEKPIRQLSMLIFLAIVVVALLGNLEYFRQYIGVVFLLVLVHNGLALLCGYMISSVSGLSHSERKSITIETGIQNSGLGLLIIFSFFNGLGGMAIIAAWWGIWHIISGFSVATLLAKVR